MVTPEEMNALRHALDQGTAPPDLRAKLARLRKDNLREHYLKQRSDLLIGLLSAAQACEFRLATPEDRERLLRVLAYVRKDDDAIPDSLPDGFTDDHDLMRQVCCELKSVLGRYQAWHLACRVPRLWQASRLATPRLPVAWPGMERTERRPEPDTAQHQPFLAAHVLPRNSYR